jgi:hypothetical protein
MVLRLWFNAGLVPEELVLDYFRDLKSRGKGKTLVQEEEDYSDDEFLE